MATCPICRKAPPEASVRPFCSRRCADVDLQRWLSGAYRLPVEDEDDAGAEPDARDRDF